MEAFNQTRDVFMRYNDAVETLNALFCHKGSGMGLEIKCGDKLCSNMFSLKITNYSLIIFKFKNYLVTLQSGIAQHLKLQYMSIPIHEKLVGFVEYPVNFKGEQFYVHFRV